MQSAFICHYRRRKGLHVRDSPGPRLKSTASIEGWTSSVGRGVSGSMSSSSVTDVLGPSPLVDRLEGGAWPLANKENTEDVRARWPGTKGCWLGDGVGPAGDNMDRSPAEREDERPWDPRRPGAPGTDCAPREDVMSMLPPPMALRFNSLERRRLRLRAWSGEEGASGRGVIVKLPRSWAYA